MQCSSNDWNVAQMTEKKKHNQKLHTRHNGHSYKQALIDTKALQCVCVCVTV